MLAQQVGGNWLLRSPSFQKIREESEKAKIRAQKTLVSVAAADMWQERQVLAQVRKEAKAIGLLETPDGENDNDSGPEKTEKKFEENLAIDPYVQLALELFTNATKQSTSVRVAH